MIFYLLSKRDKNLYLTLEDQSCDGFDLYWKDDRVGWISIWTCHNRVRKVIGVKERRNDGWGYDWFINDIEINGLGCDYNWVVVDIIIKVIWVLNIGHLKIKCLLLILGITVSGGQVTEQRFIKVKEITLLSPYKSVYNRTV